LEVVKMKNGRFCEICKKRIYGIDYLYKQFYSKDQISISLSRLHKMKNAKDNKVALVTKREFFHTECKLEREL
tara:strand:- start:1644 stop:1862 length:219 start_codon:yes stop_codon:yes gene_type:complete